MMKKMMLAGVAMLTMMNAPTRVRADDWSGFYLGANAGARSVMSAWNTTSYSLPTGGGGGALPFESSPNENLNSFHGFVGPYAGYMKRVRENWVVGVEGDWELSNESVNKQYLPGANNAPTPTGTLATGVKDVWNASLRARAGYLVAPKSLVFATVGLALQRIDIYAACYADTYFCNPATGTQYADHEQTQLGWTAGVGFEQQIANNLHVRFEYRYSDYGTANVTGFASSANSFGLNGNVATTAHAFALGAAYKF